MSFEIEFVSDYKKLNPSSFIDFENEIQQTLPENYKVLLSIYNGAYINNYKDAFDFYCKLYAKEETYGLARFLAFHDGNDADINCIQWHWQNRNLDPDCPFPEDIIPFAVDGSGDKICFDYRLSDKPEVVIWHHEATPGSKEELSFVADSFEDFINKLYDDRSEEEKAEDEAVNALWAKVQ